MLEKKLIRPGEGARITTQVFRGGWRGYQGHTLVVRLPNSRSNTFRVADVVTQGIQGQPQLTFDSREAAIAWKESHPDYADWTVGRVNNEYMCIKIPLEDGSEAWLAESNFPEQGSEEWSRLVRLYPDYFRTGPGFFLESINRNFTNDQEIINIMTSSMSEEEKCRRLFDRDLERVLTYGKFSFRTSGDALEASPEKRQEASTKCAESNQRNNMFVSTLLVLGNMSEPFSLTESFNFYVLGEYSDKYEKDAGDTINALNWWRYLKDVIEAWEEACGTVPHKLGFFNESYQEHEVASGNSWKIKTPGEYCYRIKINLPNTRKHTFRWTTSRCNPYGGGPAWQEACFLTREDAERFIREHNLPEYERHPGSETTGPWYAYQARIPLTLVKVPLEDGTEVYLRIEAFPREYNNANELNAEAHNWWEDVREKYPEYFKKLKLGFFNEDMNGTWDFYTEDVNLKEDYNVPHDTFKRVIIKYVKDNGYIKGGWNGRYMTSSPTVEELNRLLRHTEDLTEYMCSPEEYTEFNTWVENLVPEGPQAAWLQNCIDSWNKTGNLQAADLKNLVSFVSYHETNIKFQRHQQEVAERERQHQEYVDSPSNTWVGEIGDTIEFTVREAKISGYVNPPSYYAKSYPMWKIVDTDGHTYSWGDTKDSVQIEPGMIIKGKVKDHTEFRGVKQTKIWKIEISTQSRLGFFRESLELDNWLRSETGLTEEQLRDLCYKNWECELDPNHDCFGITDPNEQHEGSNIVDIFFDDYGLHEFENLEEVFEYYGEDWTKYWIKEFYKYCSKLNVLPKHKLGFFD